MKKILLLILLILNSFVTALDFVPSQASTSSAIAIDNRILLKVHNKAITTMDLVRKMDIFFYRQYAQMASSDAARYQFYSASWQPMLQLIIDEELILADAEEKKIPITDGEIRQEMEKLFGPQVVITLDGLHLTFEEAFDLIRRELLVQKATSAFVHSRALADVHPAAIRRAYELLLTGPKPDDRYSYRIITVRAEEEEQASQIAQELYHAIRCGGKKLEEIISENKMGKVALSEQFTREAGDIALPHLKVLKEMSSQEISEPSVQHSGKEAPYYRLFVLDEFIKGEYPPLVEMEGKLKQQLLQEAYAKHNDQYRNKLREYYDITEDYLASFIPNEFKPFAMR